MGEFAVLKGVNSLEKFKSLIQTCSFWAESAVIGILEKLLNVDIILSKQAYISGDGNVLLCGGSELRRCIIQSVYIITEYLGQHYTLITYKGKRIMRYEELPYEIRMRIRSRCLEGASSMYSRIPKVQMEKEYLTEKHKQ